MLGRTHVVSGAIVAAALLPIAPVSGLRGDPPHAVVAGAAWIGAWGASALLPDLDHHNSKIAKFWGTPSNLLARVVHLISGGHREGTHDIAIGPPIFALIALACTLHPIATGVLVAFMVGLTLRAYESWIPGRWEHYPGVNITVSIVMAGAIIATNGSSPAWLPLAVAGGCICHILGDLVTKQGVPLPFTTLRRGRSRKLALTRMRTGGPVEVWIEAGLSIGTVVVCGWATWLLTAPPT